MPATISYRLSFGSNQLVPQSVIRSLTYCVYAVIHLTLLRPEQWLNSQGSMKGQGDAEKYAGIDS